MCGLTSTTLAGNTPTVGTGAWSIIAGVGGTVTTPTSPTSNFTGTAGTSYTLRWTISNAPCTASFDDVTITFEQNPTVADAGPDQTDAAMCGLTSTTLAGNTPAIGTGTWSIIAGAGGTITTPTSPTSNFTGTAGTCYTLRWTISNAPCIASTDDVVITFQQAPTVANAGADQTDAAMCGVTSTTLAGNTPAIGTGAWSIIAGTGGTVATPTSPTSNFTGTAGVSYTLRWTISNAPCTASTDDVVITFQQAPTVANAGPDQTGPTMCGLTSTILAGNVPTIGTGNWSIVSGSGGIITTLTSPTSIFSGTAGTTYVLRWTIDNPPCTASFDDVTITFEESPTISLDPVPLICSGTTTAVVTYSGTSGSPDIYNIDFDAVAKSQGFVDITNAALPAGSINVTVPSGVIPGTYNATLNVLNSSTGCVSASYNFSIIVSQGPTTDAGKDSTICHDGLLKLYGTANFNSGINWTTSGDGTFDDPSLLSAVYTPGTMDKISGSVKLYIEAYGNPPCGSAIDSMSLTIAGQLVGSIGTRAPFTIGPNTKIKIKFKTSGHSYIEDLSVYLVIPDGTDSIPLTIAPYYNNQYLVGCGAGGFPIPGDINMLYDRSIVAPFDFCHALTPPSGSYGIDGDWTKLHGQNPAKGGWAIKVRDWFPTIGGGNPDGQIDSAYISFTDTSIFTKKLTTIKYDVQTAGIQISEDYAVTYRVPLALRTSCANSCDALAIVNTVGGVKPYTYQWNDPSSSTNDSLNLCKGSYIVTITDALGCSTTTSVDVTSPPASKITGITYSINDTLQCFGQKTDITVHATGIAPLTYTYDGAPAPIDTIPIGTAFIGLDAGITLSKAYNFHIIDGNGCTKDTTITITQPLPFYYDSLTSTAVTCSSPNSGTIGIRGHRGSTPYTFSLYQGATFVVSRQSNDSVIFRNLPAAIDYRVITTYGSGCKPDTSILISLASPSMVVINKIDTSNYICPGDTGFIRFTSVTGGTRPYQYSVDNGGTWQLDSSFRLLPGAYDLKVKDFTNLCEVPGPHIILKGANKIVVDSIGILNITSCANSPVGQIRVHAKGGNSILEFALGVNPWQMDSTFNNLVGGNYNIHIRDTLTKCSIDSAVTVIAPPAVIIDSVYHTGINGATLGTVTVYAHGLPPLAYSLLDAAKATVAGPQGGNNFAGLNVGKYYVLVTDSRGCSANLDSLNITSMVVHITSVNVQCKGDTGIIAFKVTPPVTAPERYEYSVDGGSTWGIKDTVYIYAGDYFVSVRDIISNNIIAQFDSSQQISITEPDTGIVINSIISAPPRCYGGNDGVIIVGATASKLDTLQYALNNGIFQKNKRFDVGVASGNYIVTVYDGKKCYKRRSTTVIAKPKIVINATVTPVHGALKGSIRITKVLNVNPPGDSVKFSIDGGITWQKDSIFTGLDNKTYTLSMRSKTYNCPSDTDIYIPKDMALAAYADTIGSRIMCIGDKAGKINLTVTDPTAAMPIWYKIRGPVSDSVQISAMSYSFSNLPSGRYLVIAQDNVFTMFADSVILTQPAAFSITASITSPVCNANANSTGSIDVTTTGGTQPYTYNWSNKATTEDLSNVKVGSYKVTVTDKNLCKDSTRFNLNASNTITAQAGRDTSICPHLPWVLDGSGTSLLIGDFITYKWTPTYLVIDSLSPKPIVHPMDSVNRYILTVTNISGCTAIDTVTIKVFPYYGLSIESATGIDTSHTTKIGNGIPLQLTATPDNFVSYNWNPSDYMDDPHSRTPIVTLEVSSIYIVEATTKEGCTEMSTLTIDVADKILIPSGFTPNYDGINDIWEIDNASAYPTMVVQVFNRWGNKVFESKGYDNISKGKVFDGTRNGRLLPTGTYYYVITIPKLLPLTGTVTIVR
jgi:gliding motility-associated-like protein